MLATFGTVGHFLTCPFLAHVAQLSVYSMPLTVGLEDCVIQHNEVRDLLAQCMREAGHSVVETEPKLQKLSGEVFNTNPKKRTKQRVTSCVLVFGARCGGRISM